MQLVVQSMTFPTPPSTQAKLAIYPLCSQNSLSVLLLGAEHGLQSLMDLSLSLICELLKGHKELCLINPDTPNTQSRAWPRAGFKMGMLMTKSLQWLECHTYCVLSNSVSAFFAAEYDLHF